MAVGRVGGGGELPHTSPPIVVTSILQQNLASFAGQVKAAGRANPPMRFKRCRPIIALGVRHRPIESGEAASGYRSIIFSHRMSAFRGFDRRGGILQMG